MKRQRSPSPRPVKASVPADAGSASDDEKYERPTFADVSAKWKVNWKDVTKTVKKLVEEGNASGLKAVMRFFEHMSEENEDNPFIDMRLCIDAALPESIAKLVKKRVRKLCRELNFEETVNPGDGSTRFRAPKQLTDDICDPFELMECAFEEAMGLSFETYFSENKPQKIKKRKTEEPTYELPDHIEITGIDEATGKPIYREKTLMEMHQEGRVDKANIEKAHDFMDKQSKMRNMWGDDARIYQKQIEGGGASNEKIEYDDGMDDWNNSRFDRNIIEKGTGSTASKASAADFVNHLTSANRFGKGQVTKNFL